MDADNSEIESPALVRSAARSPAAIAMVLIAAAALLAADLATKNLAFDRLVKAQFGRPPQRVLIDSHTVELVPGWLHLHATANQGAVFGLGQGKRWLFVLVSTGAVAFLAYLFATTRDDQWGAHLLLAMFLAGVLGNMYDRLTLGYVRDMIFGLPGFSWPGTWQIPLLNYPDPDDRHVFPWIFNLADSYLCVGVAIVIVHALWPRRVRSRPAGDAARASADRLPAN